MQSIGDDIMSYIESELKFLLERKDFASLYRYLKENYASPQLVRQTNYYFAASRRAADLQLGSTRIRCVNGTYELTCKIPIAENSSGAMLNSYEYNAQISKEQAINYINNGLPAAAQKELLGDLNKIHGTPMRDLNCFGRLRTARFIFAIKKELPPLLLDSNAYLGTFDYELEWELRDSEAGHYLLHNWFKDLDIQPVGKIIPKVKRFFDRLMESEI